MIIYTEPGMVSVGDTVVLQAYKSAKLLAVAAVLTVKSVQRSPHHIEELDEVELG